MESAQEKLCCVISQEEYSRIQHTICLDDFNTNYPNTNRINRIASEINEYLKYDRKNSKA